MISLETATSLNVRNYCRQHYYGDRHLGYRNNKTWRNALQRSLWLQWQFSYSLDLAWRGMSSFYSDW